MFSFFRPSFRHSESDSEEDEYSLPSHSKKVFSASSSREPLPDRRAEKWRPFKRVIRPRVLSADSQTASVTIDRHRR
uniref:Uncharacterized protein n=1 Tax=Steinernema glaseri TaxID=37863 RepID=A0A1I8A803_9BILA